MIPDTAIAQLSVLSVGDGDMKFSFDEGDPQEAARAERVIQDMLKRGYAIFVDVKGKLVRCKAFDAKKCEYIIADGALVEPLPLPIPETPAAGDTETGGETQTGRYTNRPGNPRGRGRPRGVSAKTHKATAVAPTSGG